MRRNGTRAPIAAAITTIAPTAINTSPTEKMLPNGTQPGAAQPEDHLWASSGVDGLGQIRAGGHGDCDCRRVLNVN